jgi:hypothetical protein
VQSQRSLSLVALPGRLAVWKQDPGDPLPPDEPAAPLWAVVRTADELSVVGPESRAPAGHAVERGLRALKVLGPLDFELTGVLSGLADPLAEAQIPVFAISTYDTDYVLVPDDRLADAIVALRSSGHEIGD